MSKSLLLLLVEDEPMIGIVVEEYLMDAGYQVLTALNGREAVILLEKHIGDLSGMITDIRLTGDMDGWQVAREGRMRRADLPVVYMTGDSASDWAAHGVPKSVLIEKPFASAQLVTAISNLITEADSTP